MSSKSRKIRRLNKGTVVQFISTSNSKVPNQVPNQVPNPVATPVSAQNRQPPGSGAQPSGSGGQPWHFDFGNTPPRSSGSYRKVKPLIRPKPVSESSDECLPPSQTIESDDEDSDPPSSPVLGTVEPASKRLRQSQENKYGCSNNIWHLAAQC